jgi:hypothetical protein
VDRIDGSNIIVCANDIIVAYQTLQQQRRIAEATKNDGVDKCPI